MSPRRVHSSWGLIAAAFFCSSCDRASGNVLVRLGNASITEADVEIARLETMPALSRESALRLSVDATAIWLGEHQGKDIPLIRSRLRFYREVSGLISQRLPPEEASREMAVRRERAIASLGLDHRELLKELEP